MLYDMPEATLEPVSSNIYFKSQFTHLFNYNVQALEILSKGFCVCVCVCFRHNLNEESKVIMEKKTQKT